MESPFNLPIPERIGKYKILDRIASGGMAEVFLAKAESAEGFEKLCAIKRILPHMANNEDFLRMLLDEARIAAQLSHGNIAQTFELSRVDNAYFIAMEYVLGVNVGEVLKFLRQTNSLASPAMATYIMINICSALEYAHTKCDPRGRPLGIIHRDVSPSNVMISIEGDVKLIDFGIVKAVERLHETRTGNIKGKFGYMSPEQLRAKKEVDHRSDIFSAGIMLFELLTNRNPFHDANEAVSMERALQALVPNPSAIISDIPPELEQICLTAVANHPNDRFQSAGKMAQALDVFWRAAPFSRIQMSGWIKETFNEHLSKNKWVPAASLKNNSGVHYGSLKTNDPPAVVPLVLNCASENPTVQLSGAKKTTPLTDSPGNLGYALTVQSRPGNTGPALEIKLDANVNESITAMVNEHELHQVLTQIKKGPEASHHSPPTVPSTIFAGSQANAEAHPPKTWRSQTRTFVIRQVLARPRLLVGVAGCILLCFGFSVFWCIVDSTPLPATPTNTVPGAKRIIQQPSSAAVLERPLAAEDLPEEVKPAPPTDDPHRTPDVPQEDTEQIEALRALDGTKPADPVPIPAASDIPDTVKKRVRLKKKSRSKRRNTPPPKTRTNQRAPQIPFDGL